MSGCWIFVCGASGAGKDSVMRWAEMSLSDNANIVFSRRMVTRPEMSGSDHDEITISAFENQAALGGFAWQWQAHGFHYGIDAKYASLVAAGHIVVVNGSREHAQQLELNDQIRIVQIDLSAVDLEARLIQRGRESRQKIAERLARNQRFPDMTVHHRIVNDGELAVAGKLFANYLKAASLTLSSKFK